jgi:subtilisin family serine protease
MIAKPTVLFVTLFMLALQSGFAQNGGVSTIDSLDKAYLNWFNLDPASDRIQGASVNKAYNELLGGKTPQSKIIVAVIDGGVDIQHADLQGKIWVNTDEIPENGIDDDQNGYTDDIHGWNFIGGKDGKNVEQENYEFARLLKKFEPKFRNIQNMDQLSQQDKEEYELYLKCKEEYNSKLEEFRNMDEMVKTFEVSMFKTDSILKSYLNKEVYTPEEVQRIKSAPVNVKRAQAFYKLLNKSGYTKQAIEEMKEYTRVHLDYYLDTAFTPRAIVNDNPEDINDTRYGNGDVKGPNSEHGTFVAGIIAANRNNQIGPDGIASNVEIMSVRTVPDGDERDKDVALAIRYAVDNGARVINMSFGKDYSPQKGFVDDAIRYAQEHNVLIVHAAGNDSKDIDDQENYPSRKATVGITGYNWLEVGASSKKSDKHLCGEFSNYGKHEVDLFAPGVNIISLNPENSYKMGDGTSFASPVVAGVAALVLSYYPNLTAEQVKQIIMQSATRYKTKKVLTPSETGNGIKVKFSELSVTGGVVNAYNALNLAETYSQQ